MPVEIGCPSCHSKLRVPEELLGRKVRCPQCRQAFQAVAPVKVEAHAKAVEDDPVLAEVVADAPHAPPHAHKPREVVVHHDQTRPRERMAAAAPAARIGRLTVACARRVGMRCMKA